MAKKVLNKIYGLFGIDRGEETEYDDDETMLGQM